MARTAKERCETSKLTVESAARKDRGLNDMQHRHFATIATIISTMEFKADRDAASEHFANELAKTNPRFDRARFIRACAV